MTFAYWKIKANAVLPEHKHVREQVAMITNGELELTVNGTTRILHPGIIAVIPSNAVHSGKAITDCEITDVFYPVREDCRNK
jgi:quercetin dioxygenase-like cupin family protein